VSHKQRSSLTLDSRFDDCKGQAVGLLRFCGLAALREMEGLSAEVVGYAVGDGAGQGGAVGGGV
jgi:hypothetical protein